MSRLFPSLVILLCACQNEEKETSPNFTETEVSQAEITNVTIQSEGTVQTRSLLRCVVDAVDTQGAPTQAHIEWYNQSTDTPLGSGAELQLSPDRVSPNDVIQCVAQIEDGDEQLTETTSLRVENTQPEFMGLAIQPEDAVYNNTQVQCVADIVDPDEESFEISYTWLKEDTILAEGEQYQLNSNEFDSGETLRCLVNVKDASGAEVSQEVSVSIQNREPEIEAGAIHFDRVVSTSSTLGCDVEAYDDDADMISLSYRWTDQHGRLLGEGATLTLQSQEVAVGDEITCTVEALDEHGASGMRSFSVRVENSKPQWNQHAQIESIGGVYSNSRVECTADATDPDGDALTSTYKWYKNGIPFSEEAFLQLRPDLVQPGDQLECRVAVKDHLQTIQSSVGIVIENSLPEITRIEPTPSGTGDSNDRLVCDIEVTDVDGDIPTVHVSWRLNQNEIGTGTTLQLTPTLVDPNDKVYCVAEIEDAHGGSVDDKAIFEVANALPVIAPAQISPDSTVEVEKSISCDAQANDIDGDVPQFMYEWRNTRTGVVLGTGSALLLDAGQVQPEDVVECKVVAVDSLGGEASTTADTVVENTAPVFMQEAQIGSEPFADTLVTCEADIKDPNGDVPSVSYQWVSKTDGRILGTEETLQLTPEEHSVGDEIECVVEALDAHGATATSSVSTLIRNSAPMISQTAAIQGQAFNTEVLTCAAQAQDINQDSLEVQYQWSSAADGRTIGDGQTLLLDGSQLQPGDDVVCQATFTDEHGLQASTSVNLTIENRPPVHVSSGIISLESDGLTYSTSQLEAQALFTDADGEDLTYQYMWVNDRDQRVLGTDKTITLSNVMVGDNIRCVITAQDASGGSLSQEHVVVVENSAPQFINGMNITVDGPVTTSAALSCDIQAEDPDHEAVTVEYVWTRNNAEVIATTASVTLTPQMVQPNDTLRCQVTASDVHGASATEVLESQVVNSDPTFSQLPVIDSSTKSDLNNIISCSATAIDPDGGNMTLSYRWEDGSSNLYGSSQSLFLDENIFEVGESVSCVVTAEDEHGAQITEQVSTIITTPSPRFDTLPSLSSDSNFSTAALLNCDVDVSFASDISYQWENVTQQLSLGTQESLQLDPTMVQPGEVVACFVTATGTNNVDISAQVQETIINTLPSGMQIALSDEQPLPNDQDLVCSIAQPATDIDQQDLNYHFSWFKNGAAYLGATGQSAQPNDTIPASELSMGDEFVCNVEVSDGLDTVTEVSNLAVVYNSIASLSDDFESADSLGDWSVLYQEEGWSSARLDSYNIENGAMVLEPKSSIWFADYAGGMLFKEVEGNFVVTTDVLVQNLNDDGVPSGEMSVAGLMVRAMHLMPANWTTGGENYLMLSTGNIFDDGDSFVESNSTTNSTPSNIAQAHTGRVQLRIVRYEEAFITLYRPEGGAWQYLSRVSRPDLPANLQVGMIASSDAVGATAQSAFDHNNSPVAVDNDLRASFYFLNYALPQQADGIQASDLLDPNRYSDAALALIFGNPQD